MEDTLVMRESAVGTREEVDEVKLPVLARTRPERDLNATLSAFSSTESKVRGGCESRRLLNLELKKKISLFF